MPSINQLTNDWAEQKNFDVIFASETTSTNDQAKNDFAGRKQAFSLFLTDKQRNGRGRGQNSWQNLPGGETLLSTWCFHLNHLPQPIATPLLGLGVYESLKKIAPKIPLGIKPPNDLITDKGKLGGLLVEVSQQGSESWVYIGLGMNIFAAPAIDVPTSYLNNFVEVDQKSWFSFCDSLKKTMEEALKKSEKSALSSQDQQSLLLALNAQLKNDDETYLKVSPQCDLEKPSGTTAWIDL